MIFYIIVEFYDKSVVVYGV